MGDERHDWHAAQVASAIYRSQGAKVEFEDCLLKFKEEKKEPVSIFDALSNLLGK
ncbi:phage tail assembly protein T [Gilliamella sp. Nev3-1]|uniref:phage tail assembly protein T n=1 Tax=unclassified Gilliamella TaxID=2685620 RepID=UPI003FA5BF21